MAGLVAAGSLWAEVDWNNPRLDLPGRPLTGRLPPPARGEAEGLRRALSAAPAAPENPDGLRAGQGAALHKALIEAAGRGVYEVDLNPGDSKGASMPELAALADGRVILQYEEFFSDPARFDALLAAAGIFVRRDALGRLRYYAGGGPLTSFEAFCRLAVERFLEENGWTQAPSPLERQALREAFAGRGIVPLRPASIDGRLRAFSVPARRFLSLELAAEASVLDVQQALRALP